MLEMGDEKPQVAAEIFLVQNWFGELERRCLTGK